jgi:hypothetical protein
MKTILLALIILSSLSGCSQGGSSVNAKSVIVTDESGKKMRYYVDHTDDGKVTSGFNGNESFQELPNIRFKEKQDCYLITSEETLIYISKTCTVEVYTK